MFCSSSASSWLPLCLCTRSRAWRCFAGVPGPGERSWFSPFRRRSHATTSMNSIILVVVNIIVIIIVAITITITATVLSTEKCLRFWTIRQLSSLQQRSKSTCPRMKSCQTGVKPSQLSSTTPLKNASMPGTKTRQHCQIRLQHTDVGVEACVQTQSCYIGKRCHRRRMLVCQPCHLPRTNNCRPRLIDRL